MKIAMIAMSGIRACDAELLRLGLTLPGFVQRSQTIASLPSLGLLTLAGMTPKEHAVDYIEVPDIQGFELADRDAGASGGYPLPHGRGSLSAVDYDLVAISSFSAQVNEAYELADRYRELGIPTVIGGLHVSCLPEEAGEHATAVCIGEGEHQWLRILEDAEKGQLKPYYGRREDAFDLAGAPMPAFELLDMDRYNRITVQTSRGCPHLCEFCASSILFANGRYRQKPVGKVLAEVDRICSIWERPFIEFADDNSFVNRAYWKELLPELAKRHVRWFTETDISVAEDEALLRLMRDSGCAQVLIGLESPDGATLDGVELRNNWKLRKLQRYKEAVRAIQAQGITVNGCFVLGLDGQGSGCFETVVDFVRDAGLYEVQVTVQTPFPGTPLYDRLLKAGRILEPGNWKKCTLFDINYEPTNMSVEELQEGFRQLVVKLYSDEFTRWRREAFREQLRKNHSGKRLTA